MYVLWYSTYFHSSCASIALGGNWQICSHVSHSLQSDHRVVPQTAWLALITVPHKPFHWGRSLPVYLALCLHLCACTLPGLGHSSHRVLGGLEQLTRQLTQALGVLCLCFRPVTTKTVQAGPHPATTLIQQVPHFLSLMKGEATPYLQDAS
jgi:hypothetical protein